ncbi:DUF5103 domain-containing protein [Zhouia sp. PK063]|uniref:type IX secretion system plug protein n=1 Tax=Zhouia sp. PK063 TaxID=3373602 RepID=UPI00379B3F85
MQTKQLITLLFLILARFGYSQVMTEITPPEYIKSIIFKTNGTDDQFPIIKIGEGMTLEFDDLSAREADYYYTIQHCNYNWQPSSLLKSQYLDGLDNQRIQEYKNSVNTIQPYSHYTLALPNNQTSFKVSGNYVLSILDANDKIIFSRRFVVYKNLATVGATVKRSRDLKNIQQKQVVQFTVNLKELNVPNPKEQINIFIIQNYEWQTAINHIKPQFISGTSLIYKYNDETMFNGGNEYLYFDGKDIRTVNNRIQKTQLIDRYHQYLYEDFGRNDLTYTYAPDINGDFRIRTLNGDESESSFIADYADVHFTLKYNTYIGLHKVYVIGKFNNYQIAPEYQLQFNENDQTMKGHFLLKQGFYNYKYVLVDENGKIDDTFFSGNHYETENNYTILVYYRKFGDVYDSVIGLGNASSVNISN